MNLFGKQPQERAMGTLIHDSNSGIGYITNGIYAFKQKLKNYKVDPELMEEIDELLLDIDSGRIKIQSVIDAYYTKFKNDFK